MKALILIWSLLLPYLAFGQASNADLQYRNDGETLINGSFEQGKKGYTFTVGSGSPVWSTQATTKLTGKAMQLTLSAQTFSFKSNTTQGSDLSGQNGYIEVYLSASASGAEFCPVVDGVSAPTTTPNECQPIIAGVGFKPYGIQKTFGTSSLNYEIRGVSNASYTGTIYIDDGSIAKKSIITQMSGVKLFGMLNYPIATNCVWPYTTSTSYQSASSEDLDCSTPTITGSIKSPSTKIPAIILPAGSPSGTYKIIVSGWFSKTGAGSEALSARLYDGSSGGIGESAGYSGTTNASAIGTVISNFTYNTPITTDKTISLQLKLTGTVSVGMEVRGEFTPLSFQVYHFPPQPTSTINTSNGWFIDANIGGANPSVGTVAVTTYTGIENASLDMVLKSGSSTAKIPCSATNSATGLTCSVGNESIGVVFTPPKTGKYKACFEFSHYSSLNANSQVATAFQIVETTTNTQTIIQEGGGRLSQQTVTGSTDNNDNYKPFSTCGIFTFNDTSEKTLRLMFEQAVGGTVVQSVILGDRSATLGQRDIHVTVEPVVENIQASLQGYNSTDGVINPKIYSAQVSGTGGLSKVKGELFSSCTNANPSVCTISASGVVGTQINCGCTSLVGGAGNGISCIIDAYTSNSVAFKRFNNNTPNQHDFNYNCHY